jgi:chromosome segregation ATPase
LIAMPGTTASAFQAGKSPKKQPNRTDDGRDAAELARLRKRVDELMRDLEKARRLEGELREARAAEARLRQAGEAIQRRLADAQADANRSQALLRKLEADYRKISEQLARSQALLQHQEAGNVKKQAAAVDRTEAAVATADQFRQAILKSLESPDPAVRRWGADALGELAAEARFALPALDRAKADKDPAVSSAVNAAVVKIRAAIDKRAAKKR